MQQTLKHLSTIITPELNKLTLEQLSAGYVDTLNPSILATAFSKTYGLILMIAHKFPGLNQDDLASFSLEKLDQSLITYKQGEVGFTTYFTKLLSNKFREETQALNVQKRKVVFTSTSLDALSEMGFDIADKPKKSVTMILDELEAYDLTSREKEYCKLVMQGDSNHDIAETIGVSVMTLTHIRKRLRIKLMDLSF